MNGFIYIMSNPSIQGKIKIGKSASDPKSFRKEELYTTSVPEPFVVEYSAFVENYDEIEKEVHKSLDQFRPLKNREFFTCSVQVAIAIIESVSNIMFKDNSYKSPELVRIEKIAMKIKEKKKSHSEKIIQAHEKILNIYNENIWEKRKEFVEKTSHEHQENKKKEFEFYLTFVSSTVLAYFILVITGVILAINNPDLKLDSSIFYILSPILGWFINNHFFHKLKKADVDKWAESKFPLINDASLVEKLDKKLYYKFYPATPVICFINSHLKPYYYVPPLLNASSSEINNYKWATDIVISMASNVKYHNYYIRVSNYVEAEALGFLKAPEAIIPHDFYRGE